MSRGVEYRGDVDDDRPSCTTSTSPRARRHRRLRRSARRSTKVYVLAEHADPKQQHYLSLYKMGEGPLYSFFVPYHLVHFEVPNSIARVALFSDPVSRAARRPGRRGLRRREARSRRPARRSTTTGST